MFPEITRDDVFRLETRRLWLRWPTTRDADAIACLLAQTGRPETIDGLSSTVPAAAALSSIERWRADNQAGRALHFILTLKAGPRPAIGGIRVLRDADGNGTLDVAARAPWRDIGLLDEAVEILVGAVFRFSGLSALVAQPGRDDDEARRALKRAGFRASTPPPGPTNGAPIRDYLTLERAMWREDQPGLWRNMRSMRAPRDPSTREAACPL